METLHPMELAAIERAADLEKNQKKEKKEKKKEKKEAKQALAERAAAAGIPVDELKARDKRDAKAARKRDEVLQAAFAPTKSKSKSPQAHFAANSQHSNARSILSGDLTLLPDDNP